MCIVLTTNSILTLHGVRSQHGAMAKFSPPDGFDFSHPELWPEWKQCFQRFCIATKLDKESGEVQVCTLLYSLGKEAEHIVSTYEYVEDGDENRYNIVLQKLENYFVP